ncbi:sigma-70 family RNA polymerase sigma factor [Oscillibacter sp.]|uniref:sigma-70 family RNA polymerase sigma factor n=1 Tax=Oscillibacter sp. TaxID=1945593 RepID=UPI0028972FD6|nr:sigma-70 family RNA polymerase sigma factor [Oscillibacter sp.]
MDREEFVRRTEAIRARLYRTAFAYLGGEAAALEAVDEAVYQALRHLHQLREPDYFETWLTRILINECGRELRRLKRLRSDEYLPEAGEGFDYDALPLREAVARLPQELRQIIALRYFGDLTLAETARALSIPQGTVVTRQHRALALLRLELEEGEP